MAKLVDGAREIVNGRGLSYIAASTSAMKEKRLQLSEFLRRARQARERGLANGVLERLQQVERHIDRSFIDAIFAA